METLTPQQAAKPLIKRARDSRIIVSTWWVGGGVLVLAFINVVSWVGGNDVLVNAVIPDRYEETFWNWTAILSNVGTALYAGYVFLQRMRTNEAIEGTDAADELVREMGRALRARPATAAPTTAEENAARQAERRLGGVPRDVLEMRAEVARLRAAIEESRAYDAERQELDAERAALLAQLDGDGYPGSDSEPHAP